MISDASFIDKVDFSKSQHYTLSIRLSTDGFSFTIYNPLIEDSLSYAVYKTDPELSFTSNLRNMLEECTVFHYPYKEVNILQLTNRFTLIPFELFEEEQLESFFNYNFNKRENEEIILYNLLRKTNIIIAYGMGKNAHEELNKKFPTLKFHCHSSVMAEYFYNKSRFGNSKKMYLYIRKNNIDIFCYEKNRMLLGNTFSWKYQEDILYYSLYIWKQLGFDQEKDELHLTGLMENKETWIAKTKEFIRKVFIINPRTQLYISRQEKIPYDLQLISLKEV